MKRDLSGMCFFCEISDLPEACRCCEGSSGRWARLLFLLRRLFHVAESESRLRFVLGVLRLEAVALLVVAIILAIVSSCGPVAGERSRYPWAGPLVNEHSNRMDRINY